MTDQMERVTENLSIVSPEGANDADVWNRVFCALGMDEMELCRTMSDTLSATGKEPVTHRGARGGMTTGKRAELQRVFDGDYSGLDLSKVGLTEQQIRDATPRMSYSFTLSYDRLLNEHAPPLQRVQVETGEPQ